MAHIVVFNPLSKEGRKEKTFVKLAKYLKINVDELIRHSIINIHDINQLRVHLAPEDEIIIVGGDGTVNRFANLIYGKSFTQNIYLFKAGTGNDFARSISKKQKMIHINYYFKDLPLVTINRTQTKRFLNGVGTGIDGMVCYYVNHYHGSNSKLNYFKQALKAMKHSKYFDATITTDGKLTEESKIWFISIMKAKYFGGGMKIAPKAKRSDEALTLVVVKKVPKWILLFIFPSIYLGIHGIFKKWVKFSKGNTFEIHTNRDLHAQVDGDDFMLVDHIAVKSKT